MKNLLLSTLILSFAVTISAHNSELKTFPFKRTAKLQGTPDRIAAIPLDKKIYKNTNHHYSNLRIIDESGNNIPFSVKNIVPLKTKILYTAHPSNMENLQLFPEKNMVCANFLINPPALISRCTLPPFNLTGEWKITLKFYDEFNKKIGKTETFSLKSIKNDSAPIVLDFSAVKIAKIQIELEGKTADFLKTAETSLKAAEFNQPVQITAPGKPKIITEQLPEISRINKGTLTEITVNAHRVPCSELILESDGPAAERYMEIFSKTSGVETCIASLNLNDSWKKIPIREERGDYYIIRIHNSNNSPLRNIRLSWNVPERVLMFKPPERGNLNIYYGGNQKQQMYDIEYAERYELPPQIYALEDETYSPDFEPQIANVDMLKYLMWIILIIAVSVLLILIVRIINKHEDLEEQEKSP